MIPLFKVFMPDEVSMGVSDILNSGQLSYGEHTKNFENSLRNYVDNPNILTVSGNSIFFALKLLDIKEGDEVIVSPMSCLMTTQPIAYTGAKVVWADIDPLTGSLDPQDVKNKITSKTKAIIHYHWAGYPGYIDEINDLAKEYGIPVIEDATESFGAEYKGNKLGNTGTDIVCYSFTPVRLPNAIDGGGLAFNNKKLYKKALLMRDLGIERKFFRDDFGEISEQCDITIAADSSTMNNISGLVGVHQMNHLDSLLKKQRKNALYWEKEFQGKEGISFINERSEVNPSYWVFTVLSTDRDKLLAEIRKNNFFASKLHVRNDLYTVFNTSKEDLIGVNEFSKKQLNLPCGWWVGK
jgi:perosamine synthetase